LYVFPEEGRRRTSALRKKENKSLVEHRWAGRTIQRLADQRFFTSERMGKKEAWDLLVSLYLKRYQL